MSEPYWEPLGAMPAANYVLPGRLHASAVAGNGNVTDANLCVDAGWYSVYGTNLPPGVSHAQINVIAYDASYLRQIAYSLYDDSVWTRRRTAGTWYGWSALKPQTGTFQTGALSNDTQYGFNVYFPVVFQIVPVVFLTRNTWTNNLDYNGPYARDITTDHFDLYLYNYVQSNNLNIRWMAFNGW